MQEERRGGLRHSEKIRLPPIMKMLPWERERASCKEGTTVHWSHCRVVEITMFLRLDNGRNFEGIDSQVILPIIMVFSDAPERVRVLKCCISAGISQGSFPFLPIPLFLLTATTSMNSRAILKIYYIINHEVIFL